MAGDGFRGWLSQRRAARSARAETALAAEASRAHDPHPLASLDPKLGLVAGQRLGMQGLTGTPTHTDWSGD
ncbi:MAG TPA: hypothetical protein VNG13_03200 [Mycobacteriales bacterium]|nr:hypothetical protein [Mycobacteriales bacterium]